MADVYVKTLTDFNEIYSENENLDVTTLKIPEDDVKYETSCSAVNVVAAVLTELFNSKLCLREV